MDNFLKKNIAFLRSTGLAFDFQEDLDSIVKLISLTKSLNISIEELLFKDLALISKTKNMGIKFLVMDCDGVLTDGMMTLTKNGDEIKNFNAKDGQGIQELIKKGIEVGIISAGNPNVGIIERRADMLGINKVYVGREPKLNILEKWVSEMGISKQEVAYIGDDLKDIPVLESVGLSFCPANAVKAVKQKVDIILSQKGGDGCVRELIEDYLI